MCPRLLKPESSLLERKQISLLERIILMRICWYSEAEGEPGNIEDARAVCRPRKLGT